MTHHVHVFGASGTGTTTLGMEVARVLGGTFLDTDTFYWAPTDPPFTTKRDPAERIARIERERARYGRRILPAGDMHVQHVAFLEWARSYDHARAPVRSLDLHERWMARLTCPVLRLDGSRPVAAMRDEILRGLGA